MRRPLTSVTKRFSAAAAAFLAGGAGSVQKNVAGPATQSISIRAGQWASAPGINSPKDWATAYENLTWLQRAIDVIADAASSVPVVITRQEDDEPVTSGPLFDLISHVNDGETWIDFYGKSITDWLWSGSYCWEIGRVGSRVTGLATIEPWRIQPVSGAGGVVAIKVDTGGGAPVILKKGSFLYAWKYSPTAPFTPLSMLHALRYTIEADQNQQRLFGSLLRQGGFPAGVLSFPQPLGSTATKRARSEFNAVHQGPDKAGGIAVVSGGGTYQRIVLSPQELQVLDSRLFSKREIASAYGVPPFMMGDTDSVAYANSEQQLATFWRDTVTPLNKKSLARMNERLVPMVQPGMVLRHDYSEVERILETETARMENATKGFQRGIVTLNEARQTVNLEPLPEGDYVLQPLNSRIVGADGQVVFDPTVISFDEPSFGDEEPTEEETEDSIDPAKKTRFKRSKAEDERFRVAAWHGWHKTRKRTAIRIHKAMLRGLRKGRERIVHQVNAASPGSLPELNFNHEAEARVLHREILPDVARAIADVGKETLRRFGFQQKNAEDLEDVLLSYRGSFVRKDAEGAVVDELLADFGLTNPRILDYIRNVLGQNLRGVTAAMIEEVRVVLEQAHRERLPIPETAELLDDKLTFFSTVRANRVAITEAGTAANLAGFEAGAEVGVPEKSWLHNGIGQARVRHVQLAQVTASEPIPYEKDFGSTPNTAGFLEHPLPYPCAPSGHARDCVNCHCTVLFIEPDSQNRAFSAYRRSFQ
ncbi:MAG: phage portal protein [Planctomycetota bacterium]|nr:MAG: phage portal protein [Planctomycetota bacterium]